MVPDPKIVSVGAAAVPDSALDASLALSASFAGVASVGVASVAETIFNFTVSCAGKKDKTTP